MTKVVNIIQARMSSHRFPGKMMADLDGHPVIDWVLKRSLKAKTVDETFLATSDLAKDDVLAQRAEMLNVSIFRGSEHDVLSRYANIAKQTEADVVVRVCGDRPLIDPDLIDMAVQYFLKNDDIDLVYNHISGEGQNWPRGFGAEVLATSNIIDMDNNLTEDYCREHVTPYIWGNPKKFNVKPLVCIAEMDCGIADVKCDLDTKEDFQNLKTITKGVGIDASCKTYFSAWKKLYGFE